MGVTKPYLLEWPDVDLELTTSFAFDGVTALAGYEIDILITPDPIRHPTSIIYRRSITNSCLRHRPVIQWWPNTTGTFTPREGERHDEP
jgi:hypothetical protein